MPRGDRQGPRSMAAIEVDAIGTALGPRVRLTIEGRRMVMSHREAQTLAQWLWDAAELVELDDLETCTHCKGDPPKGHTCPHCGRKTP